MPKKILDQVPVRSIVLYRAILCYILFSDGTDMLHYVTTMVCVAVNGQPRIGVIHKPFVNQDKGETSKCAVD